jgi:hypothetical protein
MTAATVTTAPGTVTGPGADPCADTLADLAQWEHQLSSASECSHPIRLTGRVHAVNLQTGDTAEVFRTWTDVVYNADVGDPALFDTYRDDHPVLVPCGNRRESVCPHCAQIYKRDARQLVRAGLVGGKGVPASVAEHPCVFATFTAPSFGPVHSRREQGGKVRACHPRRSRNRQACPHGRSIAYPRRHTPDDPLLGRALCPHCYDYESAVVFNACAPRLWQRFVTYLPRELARLGAMTQKALRGLIRPRFVKVWEYQARGVVHYHAIIRLDLVTTDDSWQPPPLAWTADRLADAVSAAALAASVVVDVGNTGRTLRLRFGAQVDPRIITRGTKGALSEEAVANYIAKYVTKTPEIPGLPNHRLRSLFEVRTLTCPEHYKRMITAAWDLGYQRAAHQLGIGGHIITKSRRFSVIFGHLRDERREHSKARRHPDGELDPWGRPVDETTVLIIGNWSYAGTGYTPRTAGAELADISADMARGR